MTTEKYKIRCFHECQTDSHIEINGVILNDKVISVIKRWQDSGGSIEVCTPKRYLNYICEVQDHLIQSMLDNADLKDAVTELLEKLHLIKNDIKAFISDKCAR